MSLLVIAARLGARLLRHVRRQLDAVHTSTSWEPSATDHATRVDGELEGAASSGQLGDPVDRWVHDLS